MENNPPEVEVVDLVAVVIPATGVEQVVLVLSSLYILHKYLKV
jgi:hypothetical protein